MFSLYSHGILGVVFTHTVGYSRPPSAVNDPTVPKQMNSGKSCLEEVSQILVYQVALINQYWVRLHGDFHRNKESTMILASSNKKKKNFLPIVGFVELLLFFQLPQGRQCLFEVRSVPDWHSIGTYLVRTNPPITFVIVIFVWGQMVGMTFRPKDHPFGDKDLRFDQFQSFDCGIVHLVQIGHGYPGSTSSCSSSSVGWQCNIPCLPASYRIDVREVVLS